MSFSGYGIVLYDPRKNPADHSEIPSYFTVEYFSKNIINKWDSSSLKNIPENSQTVWKIPNLETFESDRLFMGNFWHEDKGITFDQNPKETIITFLMWVRSIVLENDKVYFVIISGFEVLEIHPNTKAEEIYDFLTF